MKVSLDPIEGIPLIRPGDNIGQLIVEVAEKEGYVFEDGDILIIAHKIVSKAEDRLVDTATIEPSKKAIELAEKTELDPRNVEVVLRESRAILTTKPKVLITEHKLGFVGSKAGIDRSNTKEDQGRTVTLLPENPDKSARQIRETIESKTGRKVAVIINDSFGRPYRDGSVGAAIGIAGISAIQHVDKKDLFGRDLHNQIALIDELAAAGSAIMGQADERRPVIIIRGIDFESSETSSIKDILRPYEDEILEMAEQIIQNRIK